jgi:hypothetical protein
MGNPGWQIFNNFNRKEKEQKDEADSDSYVYDSIGFSDRTDGLQH